MKKNNDPSADGVLIVHKPQGPTSHDIVGKIRYLYHTRAVGHTGTLDPMASGVLVVLLGRAAKACEYLSHDIKEYRAELTLGVTSDTEDITGNILSRYGGDLPSPDEVQNILPTFTGEIWQVPPMYSALKVNGQKLCDLARRGVTVEREARRITVYALSASPTKRSDRYLLNVTCSGGTYIRTLCADIGKALGCGGVMSALERSAACGFSIEQAHTIDELEAMNDDERLACLLPTESLFAECSEVLLPPFYEKLCRNGCAVAQRKIGLSFPVGTRLRLKDAAARFFALGEVVEAEGELSLKAVKLFSLDSVAEPAAPKEEI